MTKLFHVMALDNAPVPPKSCNAGPKTRASLPPKVLLLGLGAPAQSSKKARAPSLSSAYAYGSSFFLSSLPLLLTLFSKGALV